MTLSVNACGIASSPEGGAFQAGKILFVVYPRRKYIREDGKKFALWESWREAPERVTAASP